jgi:hypothetical protein
MRVADLFWRDQAAGRKSSDSDKPVFTGFGSCAKFQFAPAAPRLLSPLRAKHETADLKLVEPWIKERMMSHDYASEQFVVAHLVRALGQPFTIVPLSSLATVMLQPSDAGDGSASFNISVAQQENCGR